MSDNKRSVSTDALETLGTCPIPDDAGRDAIHLAVEPAIAGEILEAGEQVGLVLGPSGPRAVRIYPASSSVQPLGIVDPFLARPVSAGERFWLVVFPRTITSLRHVWSHPNFPEPVDGSQRAKSERWLRDFCDRSDCPSYEEVVAMAIQHQDGEHWEESLLSRGRDAHGEIPVEFWDHVENVTGQKMERRATWFSCSC
jgi:hypothetical protein